MNTAVSAARAGQKGQIYTGEHHFLTSVKDLTTGGNPTIPFTSIFYFYITRYI
ncbi:hypothetical protein MNBD_GAMMA11-1779 [hydrothermal vent metagenome]|uniref:Uncharacterized protein n=1 Tax=hydrothermal vent metagenome TaxID=652676 RepID=A0A3B0XNQ6_9ZZZZ